MALVAPYLHQDSLKVWERTEKKGTEGGSLKSEPSSETGRNQGSKAQHTLTLGFLTPVATEVIPPNDWPRVMTLSLAIVIPEGKSSFAWRKPGSKISETNPLRSYSRCLSCFCLVANVSKGSPKSNGISFSPPKAVVKAHVPSLWLRANTIYPLAASSIE